MPKIKKMKRRQFLKAAFMGVMGLGPATNALAEVLKTSLIDLPDNNDDHIRDYLYKMHNFNRSYKNDTYLESKDFITLKSALKRLGRLQKTVGHGNFYLLSFDEALNIAQHYSKVGRFTKQEIDFLEMIFYNDGKLYGFLGEKPCKNLTDRIKRRKVAKIPYTGNYLYKGRPMDIYHKIRRDVGDQVILTSGVRSIIKQFLLFLNKTYNSNGNLSLASRSLAPPGYSYHGVSDFDVGQRGLGPDNFTERFTSTTVFKRLEKLGYINLRYQLDNMLGVRFEPWHIKV